MPLGVASKFYTGPAHSWVGAHAGGVLYVAFWILLVLLALPKLRFGVVAATVLGLTCILEWLQLWQPPALMAIRSTFVGHALLGSTFSWWDFPYYVLGSMLGLFLAKAAHGRASEGSRSHSAD